MSHPLDLLIRTLETSAGRSKRCVMSRTADSERTAGIIDTLERRLSCLASSVDELDAVLASTAYTHRESMATTNLASAAKTLRALADKIERRRTALIEIMEA
jgi:acyl-CoA reductase-like NAD-dependent aldehyde dehydrogenase